MKPHRSIMGGNGCVYLERWHVLRTKLFSIYVHRILQSDERALHDHPGWNISVILRGSYTETTFEGVHVRTPGTVIFRRADKAHRLTINKPVWSLFIMGPVSRQWGFHCTRGWTPATERTLCGEETK